MIICFVIVISTSGHETVNIFRSQTKKVKKKKTLRVNWIVVTEEAIIL